MKRKCLLLAVMIMLAGCASFQYIPSKHIVYRETKTIDKSEFSFYRKQINGESREVFLFKDSFDALNGILTMFTLEDGFELYYELNDDIDVSKVMAYLRSLSAQRFRMFYGSSSDFGMLKLEPIHPEEHDLAVREVQRIIHENIDPSMSEEEKIRIVHDYLVRNTKYDVTVAQETDIDQDSPSLTVYGTLFLKTAVCEGYARTFQLFMQELGIPVLIIEAQGMNHAWNYVRVDGNWRFIDVTYDDPIPDNNRFLRYDFFLLDEDAFLSKGNHRFDDGVQIGISMEEYKQLADYLFVDSRS